MSPRPSVAAAIVLSAVLLLATQAFDAAAKAASTNYQTDDVANALATDLGEQINAELGGSEGFIGTIIIPDGLQISTVGAPSTLERGIVAAIVGQQSSFEQVPISWQTGQFSYEQLLGTAQVIASNQKTLAANGIQLSSWGPFVTSDRVEVSLKSYTPEAESALQNVYGPEISVNHHEQWVVQGVLSNYVDCCTGKSSILHIELPNRVRNLFNLRMSDASECRQDLKNARLDRAYVLEESRCFLTAGED